MTKQDLLRAARVSNDDPTLVRRLEQIANRSQLRQPTKPDGGSQSERRFELPPPNIKRWVPRHKAAVVEAVCNGEISVEEACRRYQLSDEEFLTWQRAFETYGVRGLRATWIQLYR